MTQNTRADRLRRMIALEDEMNGLPLVQSPGVERILEIFLKRLHQHEMAVKRNMQLNGHDCFLCQTADEMIKEFS